MRLFLPISFTMAFAACGLIARWYVMPALVARPRPTALTPLLLIHCFRFIGLAFLIPGVTSQPLDSRFSTPAAYGDLLAGLLAFLAILALRRAWSIAIPLAWLFNVVGAVDLLVALVQGVRYTTYGALGALYFIPAVVVPALLVTHLIIFVILLRGRALTT